MNVCVFLIWRCTTQPACGQLDGAVRCTEETKEMCEQNVATSFLGNRVSSQSARRCSPPRVNLDGADEPGSVQVFGVFKMSIINHLKRAAALRH